MESPTTDRVEQWFPNWGVRTPTSSAQTDHQTMRERMFVMADKNIFTYLTEVNFYDGVLGPGR